MKNGMKKLSLSLLLAMHIGSISASTSTPVAPQRLPDDYNTMQRALQNRLDGGAMQHQGGARSYYRSEEPRYGALMQSEHEELVGALENLQTVQKDLQTPGKNLRNARQRLQDAMETIIELIGFEGYIVDTYPVSYNRLRHINDDPMNRLAEAFRYDRSAVVDALATLYPQQIQSIKSDVQAFMKTLSQSEQILVLKTARDIIQKQRDAQKAYPDTEEDDRIK